MAEHEPDELSLVQELGLPSREELLAAVEAAGEVDRRALAKHFGLKGAQRAGLRRMLAAMAEEGLIAKSERRSYRKPGVLPPVAVVDFTEVDGEGDLVGRLAQWREEDGPPPRILLGPKQKGPALGVGERALCRLKDMGGHVRADVIKKLGRAGARILGVYKELGAGGLVEPADRRAREDYRVESLHAQGAKGGDLVVIETLDTRDRRRSHGPRPAKVVEVIGRADDPRAASLIAVAEHGVPMGFDPDEERQAEEARPATIEGREDLRAVPLITIDPADARDHDDAVFARPDDDAKNKGGWRVIVAIADVAYYVTPGSALDRGALRRGVSCYLPDRVEPMLPERLSNDLCSLKEGVDRPCLAVEMIFDRSGHKRGHRFVRGLMRSHAKLSYDEAQAAIDGKPDGRTEPLLEPVLRPLWAAYEAVKQARDLRGPLELDTSEFRIQFDKAGKVTGVARRERFDAHRLIEEFMIQANVCAAETLEQKRSPLIYRVHDEPGEQKLAALSNFLPSIGLAWNKAQPATPRRFNELLERSEQHDAAETVREVVLRSQAQAVYAAENIGHFGLNLMRYAHFTSPIRRYADLVVHRALIRSLKLGPDPKHDGLTDEEIARLDETAQTVSQHERRAMAAERDATDRFIASYLAERVGQEFEGRITGVTKAGCFVRLQETGADGLAPMSGLGRERFHLDERSMCLVGERTRKRFALGQKVTVSLAEAAPVTGGLIFEMLSPPLPPDKHARPLPSRQREAGPKGRRKR